MGSATYPASSAPRERLASQGWLVAASVALAALLATESLLGVGHRALVEGAFTLRVLIEAVALLWARRRPELPASLRLALLVLGGTSLGSALRAALDTGSAMTGVSLLAPAAGNAWALLSYALAVVGVALMPMAPFRRGERLTFALDLTISVGGYVVVLAVMQMIPEMRGGSGSPLLSPSFMNGLASTMILVVLNLLTIRGRAIPSRRAFWLLMAGMSAYLPATLLVAIGPTSRWWMLGADAAYFLGVIPTLFAAQAIRYDTIASEPQENHPDGLRSFNPFALAMPAVVGLSLWQVIRHGPGWAEPPLAITAAALSALLVIRLVLTIRENDRHVREQVRHEFQAQAERLEALRRVAGGVAHAFNNSLTVVIGQAELGASARPDVASTSAFEQIRAAGERSATLTRHLLWFTGRQHQHREQVRVSEWLRRLEPALRASSGTRVDLVLDVPNSEAGLRMDTGQMRDVVLELVRNAAEAMPAGGCLRVSLDERDVGRAAGAQVGDPLPPGRYACIAVRDEGAGMPPEVLARVFEPFYTSRDKDPAAGLGLSVVHGVVRAHGGRVEVTTIPGRGSEFRVLLPLATD